MKWVGILFRMPAAWRYLLNQSARDNGETMANFIRKRITEHPDVVRTWIKMGRPIMPPFTVGKGKLERRAAGRPTSSAGIGQRSATDSLWGKPEDDA